MSTFTPARSVSRRKLAANRRNAKKSSGPRSEAGKRVISQNAIWHGLFCNDLVLTGESNATFLLLRKSLLERLNPQDVAELMVADEIVAAAWKLRRLRATEAALHEVQSVRIHDNIPDEAHEALDEENRISLQSAVTVLVSQILDDDPTLERLSRYEQRLQYTIHRCLRQLRAMQEESRQNDPPPISPFVDSFGAIQQVLAEESAESETSNTENKPTAEEPSATDGPAETKAPVPAMS
jgi:hypothetical protein